MNNKLLYIVIGILIAAGAYVASVPTETGAPEIAELASPAGPGSLNPALSTGPDGRMYMSWLEPVNPEGYALKFSSRQARGQWTPAQTITTGTDWFISYADFPSVISLADGVLAAHWLVIAGDPLFEAYHLNIALSRDAGKTWSDPIIPYGDRSETPHGLASLRAVSDGKLGVVWLDGRNYSDVVDEVALMYATIDADGKIDPDIELDNRVCECCQTAVASAGAGLVVAYRDRTQDEIRDISVVRHTGGQWTAPQPVARDNWEIYACPVSGPAISALGSSVAVAWFTAAQDAPRVQAVFSLDSGQGFGPPVVIDQGNPLGRVDVVMLRPGTALVSWIEVEETGKIRLRRVTAGGRTAEPLTVADVSASTSSGFPQLERIGDEVVIAWTAPGEPVAVKTAVLKSE